MKQHELVTAITELQKSIQNSWKLLNFDKKKSEYARLQNEMQQQDFWHDQMKAKKISQSASQLAEEIQVWEQLAHEVHELLEIAKLDEQEQSVSLREEAETKLSELEKRFAELEFYLLFNKPHDTDGAILAIHAGTGGTDAQDWTEILLRMYLRYCDKKGFSYAVLDESKGAEAGIKSVVIEVSGRYAYGNLKSEHGVHRLVRISPFDAEGMRHTSFALVEVIPQIEEEIDITINEDDLRIDTFRAGGKGGQKVNKTDSAVRITHLPTGIVVSCQNERSQLQNKERCMKLLRSKLQALAEAEQEEERKALRGEYTEAVWGNQIRSYVMQPYQLVKDHRTGYEEADIQSVLDGNLDNFVIEYLKHSQQKP